jgi:(p)ppGpp synthase/HD superfamily hydrolase
VVTGLVLEDGGGRATLERIRSEFGEEVTVIVEACSDSTDPEARMNNVLRNYS